MHAVTALGCLLSLVASALAGPITKFHNVEANHGLVRRQTSAFTPAPYCSTYSDAQKLSAASASFDYKNFCYYYMQPTYDVFVLSSSSVLTTTLTSTYNTYTTTTTTSTDFATSTVPALCPSSTKTPLGPGKLTCALPANGNSNNHIAADWNPNTGYTCQQQCLANPECKSFQTVPEDNGAMKWTICNLYNGDVNSTAFPQAGNTGLMWDRDCPDFVPAGCKYDTAPPAPTAPTVTTVPLSTITPPPSTTTPYAALDKRQNSIPYPTFLSLGDEAMYFACLCVTTPAPTVTYTVTLVVPLYSQTTISVTSTQVDVSTSAPNWITSYSTVA